MIIRTYKDSPRQRQPPTHGLLLDDDVFEAAMAPVSCLFPHDLADEVGRRAMKPKLGDQQQEWLRRIAAVVDADGTYERCAAEEPEDQRYHKTRLRIWRELADHRPR